MAVYGLVCWGFVEGVKVVGFGTKPKYRLSVKAIQNGVQAGPVVQLV